MADQPPPAKRARRTDSAGMWERDSANARTATPTRDTASPAPRSPRPLVSDRERDGKFSKSNHRDDGRNGYSSAARRRSRSRSKSRSPRGYRDRNRDRDRERVDEKRKRERSRSPGARNRDRAYRERDAPRDRDRERERERDGRDFTSTRDRSRSRERNQDRTRNRDRDSYRSSKDLKTESRKRSRSRSRSRSPSRAGATAPTPSTAHPRTRIKQEDHHESKPMRPNANGSTSASSRKPPINGPKSAALKDADVDMDSDDPDAILKKMMGFSSFKTTQNTKVPGNQIYGVRKEKKTEYRQYMNRVGGFNRPLSPGR